MAASFTDNPAWVKKMKTRFAAVDVDKNGVLNDDDVALMAKNLAEYRKEGEDAVKRYFDKLKTVWFYGIGVGGQQVNEDEFVQEMKQFVSQPDARERVKTYATMVFEIIDADKNGEIDLDEYTQFYRASTTLGEELIQQLFIEVDTSGDGIVQASEMEETMIKFLLSAD